MEKIQELPDDDRAIFVPAEDIQVIERVIRNWEQVRQEFLKVEILKIYNNNNQKKRSLGVIYIFLNKKEF